MSHCQTGAAEAKVSQARFLDSGEDAFTRNDDAHRVRVDILSGQAYPHAFAARCLIQGPFIPCFLRVESEGSFEARGTITV